MPIGLFFNTDTPYDANVSATKFRQSLVTKDATEEIVFDLNNEKHLARVRECTDAVNTYLPVLQNRDKHIAIGFGSAAGALALAAIIPFGLTIAMSGVAYGAYCLGGRNDPYNKFNAALEELAHCCDLALSDLTNTDKLKNEDIKAMLKTLTPLVTKKDLITIMGNETEADNLIKGLEASNAPYKLANKNEFTYHLYGYKQGGTLASLANVVILSFQKAFAYIWSLFNGSSNNEPAVDQNNLYNRPNNG